MEISHWIFIRNKKLKVYWKGNGFLLLRCVTLQANSLTLRLMLKGRVINILWVTAQNCLLLLKEKRKGNTPPVHFVHFNFQWQRHPWCQALNGKSTERGVREPGFDQCHWPWCPSLLGKRRAVLEGSLLCLGHAPSLFLKDSGSAGLGDPLWASRG